MIKRMKTPAIVSRYAIVKLLMVWLLVVNSFSFLQAQDTVTKSPAAEIKYVGMLDQQLIFEVKYQPGPNESFSVEIEDQDGYQFYFGRFKQKSFKKQYAIDKTDLGNNTITFVLATQDGVRKQVFNVAASTRVVEEVSVVKL